MQTKIISTHFKQYDDFDFGIGGTLALETDDILVVGWVASGGIATFTPSISILDGDSNVFAIPSSPPPNSTGQTRSSNAPFILKGPSTAVATFGNLASPTTNYTIFYRLLGDPS